MCWSRGSRAFEYVHRGYRDWKYQKPALALSIRTYDYVLRLTKIHEINIGRFTLDINLNSK